MRSSEELREAFERFREDNRDDVVWTAHIRAKSSLPLMGHYDLLPYDVLRWAFEAGYAAGCSEVATKSA